MTCWACTSSSAADTAGNQLDPKTAGRRNSRKTKKIHLPASSKLTDFSALRQSLFQLINMFLSSLFSLTFSQYAKKQILSFPQTSAVKIPRDTRFSLQEGKPYISTEGLE